MLRLVAAVITASSLLTACAAAPEAEDAPLRRQAEVGEIPGARLEVAGTVRRSELGCLVLERANGTAPWIVWPPGTEETLDGGAEVAGEVFHEGDTVAGTGVTAVLADLPGGNSDSSYLGGAGARCGADAAGVLVLDSIGHAEG